MKTIKLTKNRQAFIDDKDFDLISLHSWHISSAGYARRTERGTKRAVYMHREIAQTPSGLEVDHINHDKLDNRRANLRNCTHAENNMNSRYLGAKSGYRGVYWDKTAKSWYAKIQKNGKQYYLGQFSTTAEASDEYKRVATKLFGKFA